MIAQKLWSEGSCILTPPGLKEFLLKKVSKKSIGMEILVCEIVDVCFDFVGAMEKYRNKTIMYHQVS